MQELLLLVFNNCDSGLHSNFHNFHQLRLRPAESLILAKQLLFFQIFFDFFKQIELILTCLNIVSVSSSIILNEEDRVVKGFEAENIEYIFSYAQKHKELVIVYLYDLNSKPLK